MKSCKRQSRMFATLGWLALAGTAPAMATQSTDTPAAIKALEARGASVVGRFDAPGGLEGYAAQYEGQGITMYLTADRQHVLVGSLFDATGQDLGEAPLQKLVHEPLGRQRWVSLQDSAWIADGEDNAPHILYVFSDPNCPYCNMLWQQARPWVKAGKVQLRHVMVGIIKADSPGKAAALLGAGDPRAALSEHESAARASTLKALDSIPDKVRRQLAGNLALMTELGAQATPAIFYLDGQGRLQRQQGAPRSSDLVTLFGPLD